MKDYCGWRAKVGLIYMASSTVMEPEFYAMAPSGVSIHSTRIHLPEASVDSLRSMMEGEQVEQAAAYSPRRRSMSLLLVAPAQHFSKALATISKSSRESKVSAMAFQALRRRPLPYGRCENSM
jgi:hypothetical protein